MSRFGKRTNFIEVPVDKEAEDTDMLPPQLNKL